MSDIEPSIARVIETYQAAVKAKNLGAFMQLYDPEVRIFDAWGVWSYEGAAAWQTAVEAWFGSLGAETVRVTFDDVRTSGGPDFAVVSAIVTFAGMSAGGEELRSMQNRLSWALESNGHDFRIVHEHTSAPLGFEDMKGILKRAERE